ncbi:alanine racemase [Marinimicrobium agarilyticum]|uniref:alanine racemase n=1 Tax=Marinimicrobium agarilyticum TaxID=306546 RepID=UPI000559E8B0|nr:alanine racemase [Marinimicrobium agarilyticum]
MSTATGLLTIDLAAVRANWRTVCQHLSERPAAVLKADAYGLGAEPVGNSLYRAGCREFFFATLEEALAARSYLPEDTHLYILGGVRPGEESECLNAGLVPVLYSLAAIDRWAKVCQQADTKAPSVIKVDTGMTRLGLSLYDWEQLRAAPDRLRACHPSVVMSHLACADEWGHPMNREQQRRFAVIAVQARALLPGVRCSLANSSGIFLGRDWHFDMARPGASLYGFDPHLGREPRMHPVVQLALPVLQWRELRSEAAVGYGATTKVPAGRQLAIVAGGYADGLNRTIGRVGGQGYLGETRVPVVGRISMDTTIFDVTDAMLTSPAESAWIQVLDHRLTVAEVSHRIDALGYEVLTSLAGRYRRVYRDEVAK